MSEETKKLEKLTPEQEALISVVRDEWIDRFYSQKKIDREAFEEGVNWVYETMMDLPKPKIIYANTLMECMYLIEKQKAEYFKYEFDPNDIEKMKSNLSDNSNWLNSYSNFGWTAFYDFFQRIDVLDDENFERYKNLIMACAFQTFEYDEYVFAVEPPHITHTNEERRLHSLTEKALAWDDGYGFYFVNGFNLSEDIFLKLRDNTLSVEEFLRQENEEVKSAIVSYIQTRDGDEGIYKFFSKHLTEVNTFVDEKEEQYLEGTTKGMNVGVYTLFKGEVNEVDIAYVRCYCPSTDRMFFLGVEPHHTNAKDAIASLYQVPTILKNNIVSISRQGEKFTTVFDENTTLKLKLGAYDSEELKRYTSISGDKYFKLMKYEY
jgi:hypothetical protein